MTTTPKRIRFAVIGRTITVYAGIGGYASTTEALVDAKIKNLRTIRDCHGVVNITPELLAEIETIPDIEWAYVCRDNGTTDGRWVTIPVGD